MNPRGLAAKFITGVERGHFDGLTELYTEDAIYDGHVPDWRFQVQGPTAIAEQLKGWFQLPGRFHDVQVNAMTSGDLLVRFEWREREGTIDSIISREMQLWHLIGGRIAEQVVFCAGRWAAPLVERMAAEAPLFRSLTAPSRPGPDTDEVITSFNAAFGRHDVDGVMAAMTQDCVFEDTSPPDGRRHHGQTAVRGCWEELFAGSPGAVFETEDQLVAGDHAAVRWTYRWTQDSGGHVRGLDLFRVDDGKVAEKYSYVKG